MKLRLELNCYVYVHGDSEVNVARGKKAKSAGDGVCVGEDGIIPSSRNLPTAGSTFVNSERGNHWCGEGGLARGLVDMPGGMFRIFVFH